VLTNLDNYAFIVLIKQQSKTDLMDLWPCRLKTNNFDGVVVVVIVLYLDLQLPVQSMPIVTIVDSSNPVYGEVYSIQHYVIKFVSDLRHASGFSGYSVFLHK
jgi:hypothetical protein